MCLFVRRLTPCPGKINERARERERGERREREREREDKGEREKKTKRERIKERERKRQKEREKERERERERERKFVACSESSSSLFLLLFPPYSARMLTSARSSMQESPESSVVRNFLGAFSLFALSRCGLVFTESSLSLERYH